MHLNTCLRALRAPLHVCTWDSHGWIRGLGFALELPCGMSNEALQSESIDFARSRLGNRSTV